MENREDEWWEGEGGKVKVGKYSKWRPRLICLGPSVFLSSVFLQTF